MNVEYLTGAPALKAVSQGCSVPRGEYSTGLLVPVSREFSRIDCLHIQNDEANSPKLQEIIDDHSRQALPAQIHKAQRRLTVRAPHLQSMGPLSKLQMMSVFWKTLDAPRRREGRVGDFAPIDGHEHATGLT